MLCFAFDAVEGVVEHNSTDHWNTDHWNTDCTPDLLTQHQFLTSLRILGLNGHQSPHLCIKMSEVESCPRIVAFMIAEAGLILEWDFQSDVCSEKWDPRSGKIPDQVHIFADA